jgi:uncharacterized protein
MTNETHSTRIRLPIYPCLLPIKVIGKNTPKFDQVILEILESWVEKGSHPDIRNTISGNGTYRSLTIYVSIRDREHMDHVFKDLQSREEVLMVL